MPFPSPPGRILFLRPDTYGDLVLFEPALRLVREAWPQTEVAVLIREPYADLAPLLPPGVRWLTTRCNPYRLGPRDCPKEVDELRAMVHAFAPDWLAAPCFAQTWLEYAVASALPDARQIRMGGPPIDAVSFAALGLEPGAASQSLFSEAVAVEENSLDWEKNLRFVAFLIGRETEQPYPRVVIPSDAQDRAQAILDQEGLVRGEFIACAAAGTANVAFKSWPAQAFGETLAWLERVHSRRALLVGHASERQRLESVAEAARAGGAHPALWLGEDGGIALLGGLLEASGAYFGNDTGALHLAAALGRPVASIFGGGTWPRFKPVAARTVAVVQPLPCFGCGWDCYFGDAPCLRTIATEHVRDALDLLLKDETPPPGVVETQDLDASARELISAVTPRLRFQKADGANRLRQVHELAAQIGGLNEKLVFLEHTADARLTQVDELTGLLKSVEADADARLTQVNELTDLLKSVEADADARLTQVNELTDLLKSVEADADARLTQVNELTCLLKSVEADADARLTQVNQLTDLLKSAQADADARLTQVNELTDLLKSAQTDAGARLNQVNELTDFLKHARADADARLNQVNELTDFLKRAQADADARLTQVNELTALLKVARADADGRMVQIEQLTAWLLESEADRAAKAGLIEDLTRSVHSANHSGAARRTEAEPIAK